MCGIGGIVRMSERPIQEAQIRSLLLGLEQRGKEASGVVLVDKDSSDFFILKDAMAASVFIETTKFKTFLEEKLSSKTRTVLVHTRMPTLGSQYQNENNHPLFSDNVAVVHNGMVANHKEQFEKLKLERKAEVDSDIIRAICDKHGIGHKTIRELSKLSGSIAAAIIDRRQPNSVLLMRSGNPLHLGISEDFIIWASIQKVVAVAAKTWVKRFGVWCMRAPKEIDYSTFPTDSAWFFGPNEREWHQKFETAAYCSYPAGGRNWGAWKSYQNGGFDEFNAQTDDVSVSGAAFNPALRSAKESAKVFEMEMEKYYRCGNCSCQNLITDKNKHLDKTKLVCFHCKKSLKDAVEVWRKWKA